MTVTEHQYEPVTIEKLVVIRYHVDCALCPFDETYASRVTAGYMRRKHEETHRDRT